jgi:hypothetical protein
MKETANLFSDYDLPKEAQNVTEEERDQKYYPHLKQEIYLRQVVDFNQFNDRRDIAPQI